MLITTKQRKKCLEASEQTLQSSTCEGNVTVVCDTKLSGVQVDENLTLKVKIESVTGSFSCNCFSEVCQTFSC